jgi:hypothetical protein
MDKNMSAGVNPRTPGARAICRFAPLTTSSSPDSKLAATSRAFHIALDRSKARGGNHNPGRVGMKRLSSQLGWAALSVFGAGSLAYVALKRRESIKAVWVVAAAACVYLIAFRCYRHFIANRVLQLDANRQTPAYKFNDGLD